MSKVFPVIHHLDVMTSVAQGALSFANDVDGVFLISHDWSKEKDLFEVHGILRAMYPDKYIGVNFLSYGAWEAYDRAWASRFSGVWMDNAGVSSRGLTGAGDALKELVEMLAPEYRADIFASIAFKYQSPEPAPISAAIQALRLGYIPTTSGPGTGLAPDIEKIESMSAAVNGRLAVASGMTPDNVHLFAPHVSHILVATGISIDEHRIDKSKLIDFLAAARA